MYTQPGGQEEGMPNSETQEPANDAEKKSKRKSAKPKNEKKDDDVVDGKSKDK